MTAPTRTIRLVLVLGVLPTVLGAASNPSPTPPDPASPSWVAPVAGAPEPVRGFHPPPQRWLAGHRGVDLPAAVGQAVRAAGPGRVSVAGEIAGRGVVAVVHPPRSPGRIPLRTTYLPVEPEVTVGQRVRAGQRIGSLAREPRHCAARGCLHWGLLRGAEYLDPMSLLRRARPVLLPLTDLLRPGDGPGRRPP